MEDWVSVSDGMPEVNGWYLVFCPNYIPGSSSSKERAGDIMFSKYYSTSGWSVETPRNIGCVKYWHSIENPKGHSEAYTIVVKGNKCFPAVIRFETERDFLNSTSKQVLRVNPSCDIFGKKLKYRDEHNALFAYSKQRGKYEYIPIGTYKTANFPCEFMLHETQTGYFYYGPF